MAAIQAFLYLPRSRCRCTGEPRYTSPVCIRRCIRMGLVGRLCLRVWSFCKRWRAKTRVGSGVYQITNLKKGVH
ncbi:ORF15 [Barthadenovirus mellis]|uniref:ORF15 n=1 Tax=Passerine adenovirus 1 TaxID=2779174 RepID=A0A7L9DIB0_9ADEN|nr:ORF15 [Passerine adenovirus 1]